MKTLWLRVKAPFAAYRWMQAGVYRATSPTMPPSAAYGLLLNLAGIETRDPTPGVTTLMRKDLPPLQIAIGDLREKVEPEISSLYQQLHSYPVGNSGKELAPRTRGAKFWIAPVRRELLVGLDVALGVRAADDTLLARIPRGLRGELPEPRYGLPFAGDNNLLLERLDVLEEAPSARWYTRLGPEDEPARGSCRLTVSIDRADNSRTRTILFAPLPDPTTIPPEAAWTWVPRPPPSEA